MSISEEFEYITGFELLPHYTNYLYDKEERNDLLFSKLANFYFSDRQSFLKLCRKIKNWLKKEHSETLFALGGYIYYISEDFKKAKKCFLKAIYLNPDNFDNWIDLAFTLRHTGEYRVSNGILFNYDYLMHYYKYFKLDSRDYVKLKKLISEIGLKIQHLN